MASIKLIKRRIRSARNIAQITRAMELVAASKMKKAQAQAQAGKLYADKIYEMVKALARGVDTTSHELLETPRALTGRRLIILVSTNKGLCGGLNTALFRFLLKQYPSEPERHDFLTLGKKGAGFITHFRGTLKADFSQTVPFTGAVPALIELVTNEYLAHHYDGVDIIYNEFISALRQEPRQKTILPLTIGKGEMGADEKKISGSFLIEPSPERVFQALLPHYLENQLREAILEAEASEQSARMVAMRNATDNANAFIYDLTLLYNRVRQEKITYEISDMVTARLAVD